MLLVNQWTSENQSLWHIIAIIIIKKIVLLKYTGYFHMLNLKAARNRKRPLSRVKKNEVSFIRIEALSMLWLVSLRIC